MKIHQMVFRSYYDERVLMQVSVDHEPAFGKDQELLPQAFFNTKFWNVIQWEN